MKPKELNIFFNSLLYYTRIPVPKSVECNDQTLSKGFRYFPLIGIIVGLIGALIFKGTNYFLPINIAIIFAMIGMLLATGGLHEDGLADFCDGFGGGANKESILRIMKDSHIGTYGVLSLIILFLLRYTFLTRVPDIYIISILICAACSSRFNAIIMIRISEYAREINSKSLHTKIKLTYKEIIPAFIFAYLPLAYMSYKLAGVYLIGSIILIFFYKKYLHKKIGGFTGDTLGALIIFSEILFYVIIFAFGGWFIC